MHLTGRQAEVLQLAARGLSGKQIAHHLGISARTVEDHFSAMRQRTGARSQSELIAFGTAAGLVQPGLTLVPESRDYETAGPDPHRNTRQRAQPISEPTRIPAYSEIVYETLRPMTKPRHNLVGLARVSTSSQDAQLQRDALGEAGCGRVFEEKISTRKTERPGLAAALDYLRPGDTLCVWKLDRLGRSVKDILIIADDLHERGIGLRILTGKLAGTYNPAGEGKFFFTMMAAFAELERDIIHERTMAGLAAARAQGRTGGRPTVMNTDKLAAARARHANGESPTQIAKALGVSRATIYRHLTATASKPDPT
jgi:DNA invertase Pin-like site-specific DNA recombinase